jgi:signal peptidase I
MNRRSSTRLAAGLVTLAVATAAWLFLAPPQLGGRTAYVTIEGNSMEPVLHEGDLGIVRKRGSYEVGDAVLFESEALGGAHVLHRIVAVEGGRFVTQGDNRDTPDPDRFTEDAVVGELWLTVPDVGSVVSWLGRPLPLAALGFVIAFFALAGGREVSRRRAPSAAPVVAQPGEGATSHVQLRQALGSILVAGVAAVALFGALGALAWTRAESERVTVAGGYVHSGAFAYGAEVPRSAVYPDGKVGTGQAVFTELVDRVTFAFDYSFDSRHRSSVRGAMALDAVLSDGKGWTRSLVLAPPEPFAGARGRVEGVLDMRRLAATVTRVRELTLAGEPTFTVTVVPRVELAGYAGSTVIDTTFAPGLPFTYDGLSLRLDESDGAPSLEPSEEGTTDEVVATRMGVGPFTLTTAEARTLGAVGLVTALLLVAACALLVARGSVSGPAEILHTRYASRIVPARVVIPDGRWISDVGDPESLGQIAEHYDRVILHSIEAAGDVYLVDDGVAVYRYRPQAPRAASSAVSPAAGT